MGTQVVKVFDSAAARTGSTDEESRQAGFEPLSVACTVPDHKRYYPGARDLRIRLTGERASRRLLGAQLFGDRSTGVAKRIDVFATALHHAMTVDAMMDLDLSYAPPLGSPWDPAQLAAEAWLRAQRDGAAAGSWQTKATAGAVGRLASWPRRRPSPSQWRCLDTGS